MADDPEGDRWTVRGVSVETREMASVAAKQRGETLGEWFTRAVTNQANLETDQQKILHDERLIATIPDNPGHLDITPTPAELCKLTAAGRNIAEASGVRLPVPIARRLYRMLDDVSQAMCRSSSRQQSDD